MSAVEVLTFLVVFAVILAAYALGRHRGWPSPWSTSEQRQAGRDLPPVKVLLEYRNATGFTTRRKIEIVAYMSRPSGRSCLFALCNNGAAPRTFRIDRIVSIATLDGEILDTQQFLAEQLGVTA
jgi:WYL domain-containing protein